jgi:hypothetical protein
MSEMLNTATTAVQLVVAGINSPGPKATSISFLTRDGVREWAWLPNATASSLREGMTLLVEQVQPASKVQTTYTDMATGLLVELKVPKRQLFLGGNITVEAPAQEALKPVAIVVTDEARKYAENFDAKRVEAPTVVAGDQPF